VTKPCALLVTIPDFVIYREGWRISPLIYDETKIFIVKTLFYNSFGYIIKIFVKEVDTSVVFANLTVTMTMNGPQLNLFPNSLQAWSWQVCIYTHSHTYILLISSFELLFSLESTDKVTSSLSSEAFCFSAHQK